MDIKVGDFVKGVPGSGYGVTNEAMMRGIVTDTNGSKIHVRVINHTSNANGAFWVDPAKFEVIGHVK